MPFPVSINLPFDHIHLPREYMTMDAIREIAQAAEAAGFDAGAVTDHPVPSYRWLDGGGHYAQDPFILLSLIAACTTRLRLQTGILVLPYRNPFITARMVSSLDVYSGGRVSLGVGAGYLKPEYKALGVDFDRRNEIMDEYILAMKQAWTGEDFAFEGTGYTAVGNRMRPAPAQRPHPPLLIGGNSKRAIRRAVELADAWHPVFLSPEVTKTSRTASLTDEDFGASLDYLRAHCAKVGRVTPPQVITCSGPRLTPGWSRDEARDMIEGYRALGMDGCAASIETDSRAEWCEIARQFGEDVLAKLA